MFSAATITAQQKGGVIACIPETISPNYPHEYMPITIRNNDYKTLLLMMAGRMTEVLRELLHPSHYCRVKVKRYLR
jgi:hypothetical protein